MLAKSRLLFRPINKGAPHRHHAPQSPSAKPTPSTSRNNHNVLKKLHLELVFTPFCITFAIKILIYY